VCAQLHFNIGKEGVKLDDEHWHELVLALVETSHGGKLTILWTRQVQADKIILNSKPEIIIRDNEKGASMLIDFAILINRNVIMKEAEEILKYKTFNNRITGHVENKNKSCTGSNRGNCNHIKIIQKIPDKPSGKARNQGTAENNHTGHRTHTS